MSGTKRTEPTFQRNALAPALLAAAVLFLAPVLLTAGWGSWCSSSSRSWR